MASIPDHANSSLKIISKKKQIEININNTAQVSNEKKNGRTGRHVSPT